MSVVGSNIKKYRELNGVTQDELAEVLSVSRQAVSNWECGRTQPDIDTLQKISAYFGISIEELIYGEKKQYITNVTKNITIGGKSAAKAGISFGSCLAMVISYTAWKSIGWAILHGLFSWFYVIYYFIKY